jgi:ABC-type sugar transport system permease subunit
VKKFKMTLQQKNSWAGRIFILPWLIGFVFLFARPMIQSILYTFHDIKIEVAGFKMSFVGLENYLYAFLKDPEFIRLLVGSIGNMLYEVPIIVIFSLFIAVILNQRFKGRFLARAIFFLPVIISSGVIIQILKDDIFAQALTQHQTTYLFQSVGLQEVLIQAGVNPEIVSFFTEVVNRIFDLSWKSGVQILLFLAGLQSIPQPLYEASAIEGATAWESFWKITFPMISPIILVNIVYSVIDSFTDYGNEVMQLIYDTARQMNFEYSATMVWLYFLCVFIIIGLITRFLSKHIFYMEEG